MAAARYLTTDDVLCQIGQFGRGQCWSFALASLPWASSAVQTFAGMLFAQLDPVKEHWWLCNDPADDACLQQHKLAAPDICGLPPASWHWTRRSDSIVSEWDLVCGKAWRVQFVNTMFFVGFLFGAGVFGAMADSIGRKRALMAACIASATAGAASAFSPTFWWYLVLRGLTGFGIAGIGPAAFVLATEPVGPARRGAVGIATQFFFAAGCCATPLLAFLVPQWRTLTLLAALLVGCYVLAWPYVAESPRWLLAVGRKVCCRIETGYYDLPCHLAQGEAIAALAALASFNKTHLPEGVLEEPPVTSVTWLQGLQELLCHARLRRRLLIMLLIWCCASQVYYGLSLCLGSIAGNIYLNQFYGFVVEWPAYLLAMSAIDRVGRRGTVSWSLFIGGAASVLCAFTRSWPQQALASLGKFGSSAAYTCIYLYATELFPTTVRSSALGACSQAARIGGIAAPGIVLLGGFGPPQLIPFLLFGSTTVLAALCTLALPETLGLHIPESIAEVSSMPPRRLRWRNPLKSCFKTRTPRDWSKLPGEDQEEL